ncbi:hypothetical protein FB2170_15248 [Maribacter sp. HTCC2170]|nr:hypothetical protein FB2170_15248 [Maribacter sp. HTCC2170]
MGLLLKLYFSNSIFFDDNSLFLPNKSVADLL